MLGVATGYAMLLKTRQGRRINSQYPELVVVLGVVLTLVWLAFEDPKAAGKAFLYFFISTIPAVARSLMELDGDDDDLDAEWAD
ncbi:MAG: hypothetical protein IT328_20265 [Caldilineaceae bacterium]|nr:hypothetical protein [Caldilineaceae bacterium]